MPLKQRRRTPWDSEQPPGTLFKRVHRPQAEGEVSPESAKLGVGRQEVFRLHGLYVFDPQGVTPEDFREFLWAGLRFLRAEAQARGMSEEQIRQLESSAFDDFHDAADRMWTTLKAIVSRDESLQRDNQEAPAHLEPFLADEEDRPVPLEMDYREPLTLLDPDADLASSEF